MLKRPFKSLIARIAIIALALSLVVPFVPAAFADSHNSSSVSYAENDTGPVATFSATDQDEDPIEWSLGGADDDDFTIDGGLLAFKKSPNYEDPQSQSTGSLADRNVYNVDVQATGGSHSVIVTVTDVDEDGAPTLNKPQPQVGRGLKVNDASPNDPDAPVTDVTWQWARSESSEGPWEDVGNPSPSGSRNPVAADVGMYLRATAAYTDKFGSGKTASVVSEKAVETKTVANARPSFDDHEDSNTEY